MTKESPFSETFTIEPERLIENDFLLLRAKFKEFGYVKLHSLFDEVLFTQIVNDVEHISHKRTHRDFVMPGYETPRLLSVLGGSRIKQYSTLLPSLYSNETLIKIISQIVEGKVFTIEHPEECMVINFLEKSGGTHGWHLDDPKYALVMIIKGSDVDDGGYLELIPNYAGFAKEKGLDPVKDANQLVNIANDEGKIRKITHKTGECYLLNASDCLHRVAPVKNDTNRTVINFAFDNRANVDYGDTADFLYKDSEKVEETADV